MNELALEASKEIILCESLIDALTFWCAGHRNVTASYGVGGFTEDHREAFKKHGVERVWIAYDRDDAGENAAATLAEELIASGIECLRVLFPKGMDANEYAVHNSLDVALNQAQWIGKAPQRPAAKEETPVPPLAAEVRGEDLTLTLGDRSYRVRGLDKNLSYAILRVNLLASRGDGFHVDTLDLYAARQRAAFIKQAAIEMAVKEDVVKRDLGRVLLKLEELQDAQIKKTLEPKQAVVAMSAEDRAAALNLLEDPRLLDRILEDFQRCGGVARKPTSWWATSPPSRAASKRRSPSWCSPTRPPAKAR